MEIIRVGINRHYETIQDAIDIAVDNDVVLIDPGIYNEDLIIPKLISLRGATTSPEDGDIRIVSYTDAPAIKIRLTDPATASGTIYIEGLEAETTYGNWTRVVGVKSITADSPNFYLVVNKCRLLCEGKHFPVGMDTNVTKTIGGISVENCYLKRGYAHTIYLNYADSSSVTKTVTNNAFYTYSGDPDVEDVVFTPTIGYGPNNGEFYNQYDLYYFKGYVRQDGTPVARKVRAIARDYEFTTYSGGSVFHGGTGLSSSDDGSFTVITSYYGQHDVYCEDDVGGNSYNDIMWSKVEPIKCPG